MNIAIENNSPDADFAPHETTMQRHIYVPLSQVGIVAETTKYFLPLDTDESESDVTPDTEDLEDDLGDQTEQRVDQYIQTGVERIETKLALATLNSRLESATNDEVTRSLQGAIAIERAMLDELDTRLADVSKDAALCKRTLAKWRVRTEVMRQASQIFHRYEDVEKFTETKRSIRRAAAQLPDRRLTPGQLKYLQTLDAEISRASNDEYVYANTIPENLQPMLDSEIDHLMRRKLRKQLESGLVMTSTMESIIEECEPAVAHGSPMLFVGETGGAKTALAKFLAREVIGREPEIISGYSDVNGYQLMGKMGLSTKDGATISEFIDGPVVRAMEAGVPLILDEINAMPPEFLKRLNEIVQLRPGDTMTIQEDSGRVVTIRSGFCVIATANEKSDRYGGVHELSTEFRNRFTANTYRVSYPDSDVVIGEAPTENLMLAHAAASDRAGDLLIDEAQIDAFARAAHMTQRLFCTTINDGLPEDAADIIGTERLSEPDAYGLDKNVLAPRTMVAMIEKVATSYGAVDLPRVITRWVESIKSPHDRATITRIVRSHGLLPPAEEAS